MKTNCWLMLGILLATGALAQDATNEPESAPPPDTNLPALAPVVEPAPAVSNAPAPAARHAKKHKKRKAAEANEVTYHEPSVTLAPGPATVTANNLNVRGQAGFKGEVITRLPADDTVTVLEQINRKKHEPGEPAQWAKIAFPTNAHVWVFARYIDETNKTVLAKKLNLRDGPGENYSVAGLVKRGEPVSEIATRGDWMEIEPPTNAYAFVAAMFLSQTAAPTSETNAAPAEAEPVLTAVPTNEPLAAAPTNEEPTNVESETTNAPATPETESAETNAAPEVAETNAPVAPPPRVVEHAGVVRHVGSIIAPTDYELYDPATGSDIDYLYTTSTNLDLSRYVGLRIVVTGEEGLDARWKDTPVITIQRIQVVE
jgi:uncharacterized protein YgiM (DUF1202 family)